MYLIDTNIWLERMLDQEKSKEVGEFLDKIPSSQLFMTDFSLHSIGVICHRLKKQRDFLSFVQDVFIDGAVGVISLEPENMKLLVAAIDNFGLDFDDAYQYVAAEIYDMVLVSFDKDFERTNRGRSVPTDIMS